MGELYNKSKNCWVLEMRNIWPYENNNLINGVKFFQKNLDCLAKLFSLVQCKLVKKSKLMHAKCKQLFHSSTFRILHWNFEPPLLILDTEKWGQTRVWKPRRIGARRVKGGIKRETRAGDGSFKRVGIGRNKKKSCNNA